MLASLPLLSATFFPLLAQEAAEVRGYNLSWFVILLSVAIGLVVALRPSKRSDDIHKAKED